MLQICAIFYNIIFLLMNRYGSEPVISKCVFEMLQLYAAVYSVSHLSVLHTALVGSVCRFSG